MSKEELESFLAASSPAKVLFMIHSATVLNLLNLNQSLWHLCAHHRIAGVLFIMPLKGNTLQW